MMKDQLFSKRPDSSPSFIKEPAFHIKVFCAYVQMIDGQDDFVAPWKISAHKSGKQKHGFFRIAFSMMHSV